jgi:hypothetical protein
MREKEGLRCRSFSSNVIILIKWGMGLEQTVACMEKERNAYTIWWEKLKEGDYEETNCLL